MTLEALKWDQVIDGDWLPVPKTWFIGCCDCGLVHRMEFRYRLPKGARTKVLQVQVFRDNPKTGQKRRRMGVKVVNVNKK